MGDYEDIWNATILGYSSQTMSAESDESIILYVDPISDILPGDWRLFTVEILINNEQIGGIVFNVTAVEQIPPPLPPDIISILIVGVIGVGTIGAIVLYLKRRK